ncbi:membrane-associated protein, putative [Bodo saltans]|uniref:Membrane-associated protein, putative n=1 Tax=Bodo saltans TaxID=75058 RepID=A0A0S4J7U8_BODSA|nr:membrane-associated protein, putative [Bodo saltans]CUG86282.1 membrane-associated protein, putative [Bodo saltans]|eukprot:CUG86279.1 membrane-associated protein, putative [Bodo saltans]
MLRRFAVPSTGGLSSSTAAAASSGSAVIGVVIGFWSGPACTTSRRWVQFQQTSDVNKGINKGNREVATKWITKSTKDYTAEATRTLTANPMRDKLKAKSDSNRQNINDIVENSDKTFEREIDRLQDFKQRRWRKSKDFFMRQGKAFIIMYVIAYLGTLLLLYLGFASGKVNKEYAFGTLSTLLTGFDDTDGFYKRVAAWDTYINFGFAFVLNEALEIVRLPFMMFTFYTFRPLILSMGRKATKTIFRRNAAEV